MSKLLWNDYYLEEVANQLQSNPSIQFWSYTKDGEVVISRRDKARFYTRFLPEFGVYNLDMGMNVDGALTHTLVFKRGNRCQDISPTTLQNITQKVLTFLGDLGTDIHGQMGLSNIFSLTLIDGSTPHLYDLSPFVDTATSAFRFFQNGWIEINKNGVSSIRPYGEIPEGMFVWNSSIIPRDYKDVETKQSLEEQLHLLTTKQVHPITKELLSVNEMVGLFQELKDKVANYSGKQPATHFKDFVENLSRDSKGEVDEETLERINLAIGYLCHRFNFPSNRKAVVVVDRFFSGAAKGSSNGRNGKGILIKSLRNLMDYCELPGKDFTKSANDKMAFGKVRTHHELIHFDDADSKTFNTERLFTQITGDFHIRGIGKDWVSIPAKNAPKIAVTSNHPLKGDGSSYTERQFIVEVGHYYRLKLLREGLTPAHIHNGHIADTDTDDWKEEDWIEFYRYVFGCIRLYLSKGGLPISNGSKDYLLAKLAGDFESEELLDYLLELVEDYVNKGDEVFVEVFYKQLRKAFPTETKRVSNPILWNWLKKVGDFKNVEFNPKNDGGLDKQRLGTTRLKRWHQAGMKDWTNRDGRVLGKDDKVQLFKAFRKKEQIVPNSDFSIPVVLPKHPPEPVGIHTTQDN